MIYRPLIPKMWLTACCQFCATQSEPLCFDGDTLVWPGPMDLLKGRDRTREVVDAFRKQGWFIEPSKATCLDCRERLRRDGAEATQVA